MSGDGAERPEDRLADALAAYDDLLAAGQDTPPEALQEAVDPTLLPEWDRLAAFLNLVEQAWPRDADHPETRAEPDPDQPGGNRAATADTETPEGTGGARFGRFEIRQTLGQGGFGIVFRAWDPTLRRQVALKVPQPEALVAPEARKRFLREAHAAAGLDHPNIVPVYETSSVGTVAYIASAYCPGPTPAQWIARQSRPVPARDAADVVRALARAVAHAHERGVLHRDLKPSNVLLECPELTADDRPLTEFQPRITDFSLAWIADGAGPKTLSGVPLGSPPYMAPEQAEGRLKEIGAATDVYGLGCILYELLTGHPPFRGENQLEILRQVIADEPTPPRRLRTEISTGLEAIVLKCLAKYPARRYASARDLADDLDRLLAGAPLRARPPGRWERISRAARRRPAAVAMLTLGVLFVGTLLFGRLWFENRLNETRQAARQLEEQVREGELAVRRAQYVADIRRVPRYIQMYQTKDANDLLLRQRPVHGEDDLREFTWYHLWKRRRTARRTLSGHRGDVYHVEFSSGGDLLASGGKDGTVRIWNTTDWHLSRNAE